MKKLCALSYRTRRAANLPRETCPQERVEWSEKFLQLPKEALGNMAQVVVLLD